MINTVITGVSGRMGRALARLVSESADLKLVGATEKPGSPYIGQDAGLVCGLGPLSAPITDDLGRAVANGAQVVIDYSSPEASVNHARICAQHRVALVVGTTGLDAQAHQVLAEAAKSIALLQAPNTSVGVNIMFALVAQAARVMGQSYDAEIMEIHHRHKKDAPSGTALKLGEIVAKTLGRDPESDLRLARAGIIGERPDREIGIQALRGGDAVGEHTVFFIGNGERLEITHRATSRDQLAMGGLRAARFLVGKPAGIYDMAAVLGLNG